MSDSDDPKNPNESSSGVSRRQFLKIGSITVAVPLVAGTRVVKAAGQDVTVHGPGKAPITLTINGKAHNVQVEPRVTLLDALRDNLDITGAKRVCDRGECGACTVWLNGERVGQGTFDASRRRVEAFDVARNLRQGENVLAVEAEGAAQDGPRAGTWG